MKLTGLLVIVLAALVGVGGHMALRGATEPRDAGGLKPPVYTPDCIAANGVIEGARPEVALRPEVPGTIAAIYFRENEEVHAGAVLVELRNDTQKHQVALAQAELQIARAELERLQNGERQEKRDAVASLEKARQALFDQAKADYMRAQGSRTATSREDFDSRYYLMLRAKAELEAVQAERALVEAPPRADELAAAEGRVSAAEARLRLAEAELAKTRLVAPTDGRILHVHAEPGELAGPTSARPVILMADLSKRRVRAFIEELDAARVRVGQPAVITVDGLPGRVFRGTVAVVMPRMGKRAVQTDAAEEYKDLFFREVLIDLDEADELTVNLRVKAKIDTRP
jgi:multidrug resistance efflux pump